MPIARAGERHIDRRTVSGGADAVEACVVQRAVVDRDAADCYHAAILTHADYRVVASIGNVEIRAVIQGGVARPVEAIRVPLNGRKIDRQFQ